MSLKHLNLLLADDDIDDCHFFDAAVKDFQISTTVTWVHDGDQLMQLLGNSIPELPHILFLDVNMPLKNGIECLCEIKQGKQLSGLPVIVYSTSFDQSVADVLYKNGALHFIRKPSDFGQFKQIIHQALTLIMHGNIVQQGEDSFVLSEWQ